MNKTLKSNDFFHDKNIEDVYLKKSRPVIVPVGLRTPENAGSIIRLADNIGCLNLIFVNEVLFRTSKIYKTASSSYKKINWEFRNEDNYSENIPDDYEYVAIETASSATNIFETKLPDKIALFTGNERYGIPAKILERCSKTVYIPMFGNSKSMNVSHALTVVLFEWARQNLL